MPRYDYQCDECGHTIEVQQTLAEAERGWPCWRCNVDMARVIGPVGFSLKGGGWAADGYSKPGGDN